MIFSLTLPPRHAPRTLSVLMLAAMLACQGAHGGNTRSRKKPPAATLAKSAAPAYAGRPEVMRAATEIALQHQLDPAWVRDTVGQARYLAAVAKAVAPAPPSFTKNWQTYRSRFIEPRRIQAGVAFWQAHAATLARAEAETGVPAEIIVGILGVETLYGQHTGNFRVLDALATLAFDFPSSHPRAAQRRAFFKDELGQFLVLSQASGRDPLGFKGSYAGAMGLPQFMPSSWARYALDFDANGRIDLMGSASDAIGSVANYFKAFQWQTGVPTHYPVAFDDSRLDLDGLLAPDILPTFGAEEFQAKGAVLTEAGQHHTGKLALIELKNGDAAPSYVAGTENFYVITRYNWSSYYAMAVIELGQAVAQARSAETLR